MKPARWTWLLGAVLGTGFRALAGAATPDAPWQAGYGVNIHFTDARPGELEMLAASGCRWVRMDLTWGRTERVRDVYDFEPYDRLVRSLEQHQLRALFILDYGNVLYDGGLAPHTETGRAAFARWAAAAVARYRGRGYLWEIWNEPNLRQFWKPEPNVSNYVALARAVAREVRAVAPGERLIGPATSGIDLEFVEGCLRGGVLEDWWAISVHPYRQTEPETVVADYGRLRDLIRRYAPAGRDVPVLSGEWGYSTAWRGIDASAQGMFLARQWLVNASVGVPLSIWYDWRDDGVDPADAEHNFGTVRYRWQPGWPPFEPKPAWYAMRGFHRALDRCQFVRRISRRRVTGAADPSDWLLLFRGADQWRLAMWTTATGGPAVVRVPGLRKLWNHVGQEIGPLNAGELEVRLTTAPLYAELDAAVAAELCGPSPWDWSDARIGSVELGVGADGTLLAELRKSHGAAMCGRLRAIASGRTNELEWAAGEGASVVRAAPLAISADTPVALEVVRDDGVIIALRSPLSLVRVAGWGEMPLRVAANTDRHPPLPHQIGLQSLPAPADCPAAPGGAVRISIATEAGFQYFPVTMERPEDRRVAGRPAALVAWAKVEGDSLRLTCRLEDSSGEVFQPPAVQLQPADGWRLVKLPFVGSGVGRWGGDGDGVLTLPLRWQAVLLVDRDHARAQTGAVVVAGAALLYEESGPR